MGEYPVLPTSDLKRRREEIEYMTDNRRTYSKAEYDYMKRQRAFAWAKFYEAKQEQADSARLILQQSVWELDQY